MTPEIQQIINQPFGQMPFLYRHPELGLWLTIVWMTFVALCAGASVVLLWRIDRRSGGLSGTAQRDAAFSNAQKMTTALRDFDQRRAAMQQSLSEQDRDEFPTQHDTAGDAQAGDDRFRPRS